MDEGERSPRGIALRWRTHDANGLKPKLGLDVIVRAAIELADAEGLAPLSMRRVAERLGVGTMSLYTYVPGKAELLDLMVDQAVAGANQSGAGTWRERVERIAHENWWRYHRHPWLLELTAPRPALGPNVVARYDHELAALDGIGLTDIEMDAVVGLIAGHVESSARRTLHASTRPPIHSPERFPTARRVGSALDGEHDATYAPEHSFEFGLLRILDGVQTLLEGRTLSGQ